MSAFDLYQLATVQIGEGDRSGAARSLERAIARIDSDGVDRELRGDLASLRRSLLISAGVPTP